MAHEAICRFEDELERNPELADRLAYARSWYAIENDTSGSWKFGPSKFVGYEGLDAESYLRLSNVGLDGKVTEHQLRRWFVELPTEDELHATLVDGLTDLLARYSKTPSMLMRISVPRDFYERHLEPTDSKALRELLRTVARSLLSESDRKWLKRRL